LSDEVGGQMIEMWRTKYLIEGRKEDFMQLIQITFNLKKPFSFREHSF
jgi:hypothetical protein